MLRELGDALGLAVGTPLVLLLEDLHWADPSSVDLLRHLGQRIVGQRLLVVGTYRPEDVERGNHPLKSCRLELQAHGLCEGLALGSLSHENLAGYLDARFTPNDFPREFPALCSARPKDTPCSRPASSSSSSSRVTSRTRASAGVWRGHSRRSPWRPRRASAA